MAQTNSECNSSLISTRDLGPVGCDVEDPHKVRAERCGDARDNSPSDLLLQAFRGLELSSCEHQALPAALSCSYGGPCEGEVVISTEVVKDSSSGGPQDAQENCAPKCLGESCAGTSSHDDVWSSSHLCHDIRTSWELISTAETLDLPACKEIVDSRLKAAQEQLSLLPESAKCLQMTDEQLQAWKLSKCMILSTATHKMIQDKLEAFRWKEKWMETSDAYVLQCLTSKALKDQLDDLKLKNAFLEQQVHRSVKSSNGQLSHETSGDVVPLAGHDTVGDDNSNKLSVPIFENLSHAHTQQPRKRRLCAMYYHDALAKYQNVD